MLYADCVYDIKLKIHYIIIIIIIIIICKSYEEM
jgi:hypothetical protein